MTELPFDRIRLLALSMTPQERLDLADDLFHSVSDDDLEQLDSDDDFELSPDQMNELNRRIESVRNGTAVLIDVDVHLEQMRQMLKDQRATREKSR